MRKAADLNVCSVELHAPRQMYKSDSFALFATVAFDVKREDFVIENKRKNIRFGFHSAELWVFTENCRKAPQGRYYEDMPPIKVKSEAVKTSVREGAVEAGLAASIPAFGKFLSGKFGLGGKLSQGMTQKVVESGETEIVCSVVQRHNDYWRMFGYKNQEGLLVGQIVGDEPLCDIDDGGEGGVISASLRVDLLDLFVEVEGGSDPAGANRNAVCAALIGKRLKRRGEVVDTEAGTGVIALASDSITVNNRLETM